MPLSKEVVWNGVSSTTIPELVIGQVWRDLIGKPRTILRDIPGRQGAWIFDEERGMREIRMQCFIEVDDIADRRDAVTAVAKWLDFRREAPLTISDEPDIYYLAVLGEAPKPEEWRDLGTFDIKFLCQPHSHGVLTVTHTVNGDESFVDEWDPEIEIELQPVIEVTPTNGTLTAFEILLNGDTLSWAGTLASGDTLTIDSINVVVLTGAVGDVSLTGAYNPALLTMQGVFGSFPNLVSGVNSMAFTRLDGTATAVTIVVKYRKRYYR